MTDALLRSNTEYSQLQRQLANHKVDGVILTYAMADDPCIELLRQYETPFVSSDAARTRPSRRQTTIRSRLPAR